MVWTSDDLLTRIRLIARLRSSDPDYTSANLLLLADDLVMTRFAGVVTNARQGHWFATQDHAITAGQSDYRLPKRAVGDCLVDVHVVDSGGVGRELTGPLSPGELGNYATVTSGGPAAFAVVDNVVRLIPTPSATQDTLRLRYHLRRSKLVPTTEAGVITAINTGTRVVTCSTVPADFTTAKQYDFVQGEPGFATLAIDQAVSAVVTGASGTLTFSSTLPTDLAVGDYVCERWQTAIVQLPDEMHGSLANLVASHVLAQTGDRQGAEVMDAHGGAQLDSAEGMVQPRVSSRPEVLRHQGLLRRGRWLP